MAVKPSTIVAERLKEFNRYVWAYKIKKIILR